MSVLFAGGIATLRRDASARCFGAMLVRLGFLNYFIGGRHKHDRNGCDDMLLTHKHYFSVRVMNVCSVQCSVLVLGTTPKLTSSRRPVSF